MHKPYNVYHNLGYWFMLFIVLVVAGFYSSYFTIFFEPKASIIHIHFSLMMLWIGMLITQPFLIKYKKAKLHRKMGKVSYVLFPLVAITGFLLIRYSYYQILNNPLRQNELGVNNLDPDQLIKFASWFQAIAVFYLFLFVGFYVMAIYHRRKSSVHARYMVASALTLLGPTVDRIFFFGFGLQTFPGQIPIETAAFFIADFTLAVLLYRDYKNGLPTKTLLICLTVFVAAQVLYFILPQRDGWQTFMQLIMYPTQY